MPTLVVTQEEVPRLLPMAECIEVMARRCSRRSRAARRSCRCARSSGCRRRSARLGLMPAALLPERVLGVKVITFFPGNEGHGARHAPGRRAPLRGGARAAARRHRRDLDHGDPHGRRQRRRDAAPRARGRRRPRHPRLGHAGAHAPGGDARRAEDPPRPRREQGAWTSARAFAERESKRQAASRSRRSRPSREAVGRRRPHLHDDLLARADPPRGLDLARARTSTPSARASRPRASSTRRRSCGRASTCDRRESLVNEAGDFLIPKKEGAIGDEPHRRRDRRGR